MVGSQIIASNNDKMPLMSSAWTDNGENGGLYGGAATWLTVHEKYDGKNATWGNYVAFGGLNKKIPVREHARPAGRTRPSRPAQSRDQQALRPERQAASARRRTGRSRWTATAGHELTVKVEVKVPKLKETYSTIAVAVIDRGDGTADGRDRRHRRFDPAVVAGLAHEVAQIQISN